MRVFIDHVVLLCAGFPCPSADVATDGVSGHGGCLLGAEAQDWCIVCSIMPSID